MIFGNDLLNPNEFRSLESQAVGCQTRFIYRYTDREPSGKHRARIGFLTILRRLLPDEHFSGTQVQCDCSPTMPFRLLVLTYLVETITGVVI